MNNMETEETIALSVPLKDAEKIRRYLHEKNIIRDDLKIKKDENNIYFPIKKALKKQLPYNTVKKMFEKKEIKSTSYKEIISLPDNLKKELPTSYDTVGNIILLKLPKSLLKYQKEIGEALLKTNKNIKTVCLAEPVSGELRIRKIKVIAGKKSTKTTHTEYGLFFDVDVKNTYFSPRLATERKRIANQVKPGENIVDMFAGVAPFSIMIAKYAKPKIIYAVDKNKKSVELAKQNIKRNNVLDKIEIIYDDAKRLDRILTNKADRIIMNLPFSAHKFFIDALKIAKDSCIIHHYDILKEERIQDRIKYLKKIADRKNFSLKNIEIKKIKTYAPREFYICLDITARKHADVA